MKYGFIQKVMWTGYKGSFKKHLTQTLSEPDSRAVMKSAHKKYKEILAGVDEFDKGDRFLKNIVSCAMLSAILLSVSKKYSAEDVRAYYKNAMCDNKLTKIACKSGKNYTAKGREKLKRQAKLSETVTNPYSWKFTVEDGDTLNRYTAYFHTCGICRLMTELGLKEYIPAMCSLDYDMAALGNADFTREQTLAGGGEYCDCHYDYKGKTK